MAYRLSDLRLAQVNPSASAPDRLYMGGSPTFNERGPAVDDWFASQGAPGGAPTLGTPGGPVASAPGGRLTNEQAKAFFDQLFPGEQVSPEDLEAHRAELEAAGFQLNPNAAGRITDLRLPSGDFVDPIYGAGAGINRKQWNIEGPGIGAPGTIGAGLETSPGFQFRLGEGLKALERSAAARGTLLTGGTLKGLNRYAQDYASNEYGQRVNQLQNLAQLGAGAAGGAANLASSYAGQAGNLLSNQAGQAGNLATEFGNAQAAGTLGGGQAWQQGLGGISNLAQMYYLSRLMQPPGTGPATTPPYVPTSTGGRPLAMGNPSVPGFYGWG